MHCVCMCKVRPSSLRHLFFIDSLCDPALLRRNCSTAFPINPQRGLHLSCPCRPLRTQGSVRSPSVHRLFPVMLNYRPLFSRHNLVLLSRPSLLGLRADARPVLQASFVSISKMERELDSIPHIDRTANEPRDPTLHSLSLAKIDRINPTTRLFKLRASGDGVKVSDAS